MTEVLRFQSCDSTNEVLKRYLRAHLTGGERVPGSERVPDSAPAPGSEHLTGSAPAPSDAPQTCSAPAPHSLAEPIVAIACEQTMGKGRLGRTWRSPAGGLYFSLLWPTPIAARVAPHISLLTVLAAQKAVAGHSPHTFKIKWPNDLLLAVAGRDNSSAVTYNKVAGILVELIDGYAIAGIGVNLWPEEENLEIAKRDKGNHSPGWLCAELSEENREQFFNAVAGDLTSELTAYLMRWQAAGCSLKPFLPEYQSLLAQIGEQVEVHDMRGGLLANGMVSGIDADGLLLLHTNNGEQAVAAGEVTLRKPL